MSYINLQNKKLAGFTAHLMQVCLLASIFSNSREVRMTDLKLASIQQSIIAEAV
jgi:hypothetical protein